MSALVSFTTFLILVRLWLSPFFGLSLSCHLGYSLEDSMGKYSCAICHSKQMPLRQYFERGEDKSLLFAWLSTVCPLHFRLIDALKGTYKVLNRLSVHLHQGITWYQLKEISYGGRLHIYAFYTPKERHSVFSNRNNIEGYKEVAEFLLNESLKRLLDYQGVNKSWLKIQIELVFQE